MSEERVHTVDTSGEVTYSKADWLIFSVSFTAMLLLLWFEPRFFWVALPFAATYLVKALRMM